MVREWGGGNISWSAVARVVLPEEVGPERAMKRGGWLEEDGMGCVILAVSIGGFGDVGSECLVGMVGRGDITGSLLKIHSPLGVRD